MKYIATCNTCGAAVDEGAQHAYWCADYRSRQADIDAVTTLYRAQIAELEARIVELTEQRNDQMRRKLHAMHEQDTSYRRGVQAARDAVCAFRAAGDEPSQGMHHLLHNGNGCSLVCEATPILALLK